MCRGFVTSRVQRGYRLEISTRYMCNILSDMRNCYKTRNFSYLESLIEEAQYRAERMENRIEMMGDVERYERSRIGLKKEIAELEEKRDGLKDG